MAQDQQFQSRMQNLNELLERIQNISDPAVRDAASQIIQSMMEFHGTGLTKIIELIADAGEVGQSIIDEMAQDELISNLLLLYDLHPVDLQTRVQAALEKVQPYLASHGGHVELVDISADRIVRLKLEGSCHGCHSSQITLRQTIETALLAAAPDIAGLSVEGAADPEPATSVGFVPISSVAIRGQPAA
ncbi:MAG TPA: NifU family protein [Tepidisphaeraceae bacterium]|nr:NifU family protein [Tepidisphaeraceae bacterium]